MTAPIEAISTLALTGGSLISTAAVIRLRAVEQWRGQLTSYELRFPRSLDETSVVKFISGLSGLLPSKWRRWYATHAVIFETRADGLGIHHYLLLPEPYAELVLGQLRAALPGVRVTPVDVEPLPALTLATQLELTNETRPLGDGRTAASAALIAVLGAVKSGETAVVQWVIQPTPPAAMPPELRSGQRPSGMPLVQVMRGMPVTSEERSAYMTKHAFPNFSAAGRIGVAAEPARARSVFVGLLSALHHLNAPGVHLRQAKQSSETTVRALMDRRPPMFTPLPGLNAEELSGGLAWPIGITSAPGLELGSTRQLAPHPAIPQGPRVIGEATYPGAERPIALSLRDSLRHVHLTGPTGSGKSTLLVNLITQDMRSGRGVFVVDPKGDLIQDVLDRVPPERVDQVVLLDALDSHPVGVNLLERPGATPELVVEQVVGVFAAIFHQNWGVRSEDLLRSALLALVGVPGMTLVEVPLLLADEGFRRRLVAQSNNFVLDQFWSWYEALSSAERAQIIAPLMNKLRAVLLRPQLRGVFGQPNPAFDMDRALAERKIVLVPLTKGLLGEDAAALLGSLIVTRLWQAVTARAALPSDQRPITMCFIDEFHDSVRSAADLEAMLAQGRGLGLGLHLAHQHLDQLPVSLRRTVMANARSRVSFQPSADDARTLAKELAPHLTAEDLQALGPYEVVATLSANGQVTPPVTARTYPPPPVTGMAEAARAASRARYGRDRGEIEAEMLRRHGHVTDAPHEAIGRREVQP